MNIHHLELFYFVAKHGGIAAAVRNIPYGIQQPAVSGQIAKLEESLGTKLFQRRPFALSPAGMELFEFIKPFFDNVEIVGEKLRQNRSPQLRIAAPSIVLHDYIPELLQKLRTKFPRVSPLPARSSACRSREITPGPRYRSCDYPPREKTARWNPGSTVTQTAIDSTRPQKVQTRSCGRAMEAR